MDSQAVSGDRNILYFHTDNGMVFKCLSKILNKNFIDAAFMITQRGIFLQENTENHSVMIECLLKSEKFLNRMIPTFEDPDAAISLGFSAKDFKEAVDRIMKTDQLKMYVKESNYSLLHIEISNPSKGTKIFKYITLKKTNPSSVISQNYDDHNPTAVIMASQFKKATTDANKSSKTSIRIRAQQTGILMEGTASNISGFREMFGNWIDGAPEIYDEFLSTAKLHSFSDVAPVAKTIQIYACDDDRPLKISAAVGELGTISFYIQPDASGQGATTSTRSTPTDSVYGI